MHIFTSSTFSTGITSCQGSGRRFLRFMTKAKSIAHEKIVPTLTDAGTAVVLAAEIVCFIWYRI